MSYKPFDVPRLINCGKCGGGGKWPDCPAV